jgi:hypothetical protein
MQKRDLIQMLAHVDDCAEIKIHTADDNPVDIAEVKKVGACQHALIPEKDVFLVGDAPLRKRIKEALEEE